MFNTSAGLMLQTIMIIVDKQNLSETTRLPSNFLPDAEVERCYIKYGCFSNFGPWVTETRPVGLFPIPPDKMNIKYPAFTRRNMGQPLILNPLDTQNKIKFANIDPAGPFYFISHGYIDSGDKPWIQKMTESLLMLEGNQAATVIVVDWRGGSIPPYTQAVANVRLVGAMTAFFIYDLYVQLGLSTLDHFHFIGHSLGAHCGGYVGYTLQKKFGLTLGRITGLDPAEPHFAKTQNIVRLDRTDAKYVDIIHSDATPFVNGGFGMSESIGHVDFFPNGGSNQPGCGDGVLQYIRSEEGSLFRGIKRYLSCNHVRTYSYFIESIAPSCPFLTIRCSSYQDFLAGHCFKCGTGHPCIPFGFHSQRGYNRLLASGTVSADANLNMYSMTSGNPPYCRLHYRVTFKVSGSAESETHGGEIGRLWLILLSGRNDKSDKIPLDPEGGAFHAPGSEVSLIVPARSTGAPPHSAIVEWEYQTNLLNPLTWRILSSPRIYVTDIRIDSLEYVTSITVCAENDAPVVANMARVFQQQNCKSS